MKLAMLRSVLMQALSNERSDFYRKHFADRLPLPDGFPRTWEEWESLPILTRETIASVPVDQRTFVSMDDAPFIFGTSGTTGRGILYFPRRADRSGPQYMPGATAILGFRLGFETGEYAQRTRTIYGDVRHLTLSAILAGQERVDGLDGSASVLLALHPLLVAHWDPHRIRFITLHSERCTKLQYQALTKAYPNASISSWLSMTEYTGFVAYSPDIVDSAHLLAVASGTNAYLEVVDARGKGIEPGGVGHMLATSLSLTHAFPIIRCRSDDPVRLLSRVDGRVVFEVLGRDGDGRVRVPGGEFSVDGIDEALTTSPMGGITDFEARVFERGADGVIRTQLEISLYGGRPLSSTELSTIARHIEHSLKVNNTKTYREAIERGLYDEIVCRNAAHAHAGAKRRRLLDARH